jgi:S1-C subfamily serine protease
VTTPLRFALLGIAAAPLAALSSVGAQQSSSKSHGSQSAAPSGWVGLSVIQSGHGDEDSDVKLAYPVVASVDPGSPAQAAGLVAGDTILAYNDVSANSDAMAVKRFLTAGQQIVVKVRRNGVRNLRLTVAKRTARNAYREGVTVSADGSAEFPIMSGVPSGPIAIAAPVATGREAPFAGSYLASLNAGLASALDVRNSGVLVVDVGNGSAAMRAGLEAGDVITRADSLAVSSPLEIATAMRLAAERSITLDVSRRGKSRKITVSW